MKLKFTKSHGLGNDFIIIDNREDKAIDFSDLATKICRRRFSVGADGILVVDNSDREDIKMKIYNSDGSEAEMCGNGIRCFAKYLHDRKIIEDKIINIETKAGLIKPEIIEKQEQTLIRVNMGKPGLKRSLVPMTGPDSDFVIDETLEADGRKITFSAVSTGVPHCLVFTDEITDYKVRVLGPIIEKHPIFPVKTNVEFINVIEPSHIDVRVWERGAGETMACGTGACACAVAGIKKGLLNRKVTVSLPGGDLIIEWDGKGDVYMTGTAEEAFTGQIEI